MYILGLGMLIAKLFRNIFFLIDSVIFNQIPKIYNLLLAIVRTSPLSQADIVDMASRIYKLLAVFMIFKVTFSLIMYVVNPEDFSDKSKGVSKLITNIVISLALLVLTPYIFSWAYQLQTIVLENNTLAAVIFGEKEGTRATLNNAGDNISFLAISPFIIPNLDHFDCATLYTYDRKEKKNVLNEACFGFADVDNYSCDGNDDSRTLCKNVKSSSSNYLQEDDIKNYAAGLQFSNYNLLLRSDLITKYYSGKDNEFAFDYSYIMSTVVGVLIVLFLITTCMDIGLRSIKLAFLQLIAPIPILSYIDPKGGKDGMFKKWYDMAFKTYLSIFVRLLALYFAIYIIGRVNNLVDIIDGSYVTNGYIKIFIIIGALMFAKNFIKILESLGIKFDGGFEINPIKKIRDQALGGKQLLGATGAVAAGATAGAVNFGHRLGGTLHNIKDAKGIGGKFKAAGSGLARTAGSTIAGTSSALTRGLKKAGKGEGMLKTFGDSYGEAMFAKKQREDLQRKVGAKTMGDRIRFTAKSAAADIERWGGIFNAGQRQEMRLADVDAEFENRRKVQKLKKEDNERRQQALVVEKNDKIKEIQRRKDDLSTIISTITTSKFTDAKGRSINVKDREENVKQMQERGEFYVKLGDTFHKEVKAGETYQRRLKQGETYHEGGRLKIATRADVEAGKTVAETATSDLTVEAIATQSDVNNLALTDAGQRADKDLKAERKRALESLSEFDEDTKTRIEELKELLPEKLAEEDYFDPITKQTRKRTQAEIDADIDKILTDPSMMKAYIGVSTRDEAAVNTRYAEEERALQEEKNNIDLELKTIEEQYKATIEREHLDKTSREWIENEAANAARGVHTKEPEGFKISPSIDETAYTPFNAGLKMGSGPSGGPGLTKGPGPGHGHH